MNLIRWSVSKNRGLSRQWMIAIMGFILAFGLSGILSAFFPYAVRIEHDLWFGADVNRVIGNMVDPSSGHWRTYHHPLFSLSMLPLASPIFWAAKFVGFQPDIAKAIAAQLIVSFSAGITWILIYVISLQMGLSIIQSFVIGLLFLSSSAFVFWWSTPETFPLGAPTILLPFLLLSLRVKSMRLWIIAIAASGAMTITNFAAGFISAYIRFKAKKVFYSLCAAALISVSLLSVVQKAYLPNAQLGEINLLGERKFIKRSFLPLNSLYGFFVTPVIAPSSPSLVNLNNLDRTTQDIYGKTMLQLHFEVPTMEDASLLRSGVALTWMFFLINGVYVAWFRRRNATCIALIIFLVFQFFLHSIYGDSPFLYSAHYVPVMFLIAGYGLNSFRKSGSRLILLLAFLLTTILGILNVDALLSSFDIGLTYIDVTGPTTVKWCC